MFVPAHFGISRTRKAWPVSPWGGMIFGYRLPSQQMRTQWRSEGLMTKEEREKIKDTKKQAKLIERQNLDPRTRGNSQFYVEGLGIAPWTINYEYTVPLHRSGIPMFSVRTGIGYASSLSIPVGVGIGGMKNGHGGFLVGGTTIVWDNGTGLSFYFGANFQVHAGKGISVGFGGYGLINPYWGDEQFFTANKKGIAPMAGLSLGYRLRKFNP